MKYPEMKEIRRELKFLTAPRDDKMNDSLRIKCAHALELLVALEAKLRGDNQGRSR
jgi:hypothetical protein